ncbi:MAG: hypothetical protein M3Y72_23345, partial [Acidobacteriota bacterium]|nr:hypothetical protein [Acidobacteriota bacterium]
MVFAISRKPSASAQGKLGWKVVRLLRKHRRTAFGLGLLILLASALDITVPFLTKGLIDKIMHSFGTKSSDSVRILATAASAIFAATAATRLLRSFYNYRLVRSASQAEDEVKNAAFANFLRLDTEFHAKV